MVRRFSLVMSGSAIAFAIGCSDPATLPAKGALAIALAPPPPGTDGTCPTTGTFSMPTEQGAYADILDTGSKDIRVTDGKDGYEVKCTVLENDGAFDFSGSITRTGANFSVSGAGITVEGGGMANIGEIHPDGIAGTASGCMLTIKSLHAGAIWAAYSCDHFNKDVARCSASGAFIFENCNK